MEYLEILELIVKKDKKGLELLYKLYGEKFFGYAVDKWKLEEDEAWNIVYNTLETLILKLSDYHFESKTHFENFIFKVFINFLRQYYRRTKKIDHKIVNIDIENISLDGLNGDSRENLINNPSIREFYQNELPENPKMAALKEALDKLDEIDKDILLLRAQNYSYEEINMMLNLQDKQLKVRHFRAKEKLIKLLQTQSNEII